MPPNPAPTHAVYPGTFDPFTAGHRDLADRARRLVDHLTVLVAVNSDKQPTTSGTDRAHAIRTTLPPDWTNVTVTAWHGLTADYCHQHDATLIVRGLRNTTDAHHEHHLAAMNQTLGITTLLLPARPELAATSSTTTRATHLTFTQGQTPP